MTSTQVTRSDQIRLAVIDDHPLFREGVIAILQHEPSMDVIGQGATAEQAIQLSQDLLPDILLLDINIPGGGIEATQEIARLCPFVKVIMLTASENEQHVSAALEAGARGYVLKGIGAQELVRTIHAVHLGESYVTPQLAARLLTMMKKPASPIAAEADLPGLTRREEEILDGVAGGRTNKEIARTLNISEKTVKHYMTNIMHKLQVRNRVEAALMARKKLGSRTS
ncbi:MAG: LuxR C-terminal-related transcriptional regulator [Hyphomicrobium sp.]